MKKFLIVLMAAMFLIAGMAGMAGIAEAGGSIYAKKLIGDTGMGYSANLNETFGKFNVYGNGDFSSDVDGITKIYTDELEGGFRYGINKGVSTGLSYGENYRSDTPIELLKADISYTWDNGASLQPSIEHDVRTGKDKIWLGAGIVW